MRFGRHSLLPGAESAVAREAPTRQDAAIINIWLRFVVSCLAQTPASHHCHTSTMAFKDARQGAASIVFFVVFATLTAINIYGLVTRRPKRRFAGSTIFTSIRVGAMIAGIGWSVVLYDNFGWLIASLVLGAEGGWL